MSQTATVKPQNSEVGNSTSIGVPILFAITLFVSALLLFLVQPMIAKMILPFLGGSPAVWNTCQVFFQAVLLIGYTYAHVSTGWMGVRKQGWLHMGVMLIPLAVLPLSLRDWAPPNGDPVEWLWWIFLLLSVSVGLPFFILSTTAPLLQRWFTETGHPSARDPYFLYAASNMGSMLALLGYPSLVEPFIPIRITAPGEGNPWASQVNLWAIGYCCLLGLLVACRIAVAMSARGRTKTSDGPDLSVVDVVPAKAANVAAPLTMGTRLRWIALAFVPSSLMLGVTTYLTLDIAAIPLLWVIPLSIYLLSFILVFARWPQSLHMVSVALMPLLILLIIFLLESGGRPSVGKTIMLYLGALFVVAMMCHGELARTKPEPSRLTEFYLLMSVGGVLGGLFNGIAAPLLFHDVIEHKLAMVFACFLLPAIGNQSSLLTERLFGLRPNRVRGVIVDLAAGILLGCVAYGLLEFNSTSGGGAEAHPVGYKVWESMQQASVNASNFVNSAANLSVKYILRRPDAAHIVLVRPRKLLTICLYGLPILACFIFATRPLRFGTAVTCFVIASSIFDNGLSIRGHQIAVAHEEMPLFQDRSFFGVLKVVEEEDEPYPAHSLYHGTTLHGMQYMNPELQDVPITYYYRNGPVGQAFKAARQLSPHKKLAVIGLGSGTTACYGEKGDTLTYYEIDNLVRSIATNPAYFTFLTNCEKRGCPIDIIMGDARQQMVKAEDHSYDMIIVDAFSSDAIPVHLLTKQAVEMYFKKLAPHGYLLVHISNRYLNLTPVVARIAEKLDVPSVKQYDTDTIPYPGKTSSDWIVLAKEDADLLPLLAGQPALDRWSKSPPFVGVWPVLGFLLPATEVEDFINSEKPMWKPLELDDRVGLWTDDYSNLLRVFDMH
jgi:hypothetical protein